MLQSYNRKEMDLDHRTIECVNSTPIFADFMQRYDMAYGLELEHFLNVLEGKKITYRFVTWRYAFLKNIQVFEDKG